MKILSIILLTTLISCSSNYTQKSANMDLPSEHYETKRMGEIYNKAVELGNKYGANNVLVVLDIDNTILTMNQELGSDQWFTWQSGLIKKGKCLPACISESYGDLLKANPVIFAMSSMSPTEKDAPDFVEAMQLKKFSVIALTSRGYDLRSATEKELKRNKYNFTRSSIGSGEPGHYAPYSDVNVKQYGIDNKDIKANKNMFSPRKVSFQDGVYMTAGQNKGVMLKALLHKYKRDFKAVIFADDHSKHTTAMQAIMKGRTHLVTYRYGAMDAAVEKFKKSNKKAVIKQWSMLKKVQTSIFK